MELITHCEEVFAPEGENKMFLIKETDCVFENGVMVRIKRKYGKHDRKAIAMPYRKYKTD